MKKLITNISTHSTHKNKNNINKNNYFLNLTHYIFDDDIINTLTLTIDYIPFQHDIFEILTDSIRQDNTTMTINSLFKGINRWTSLISGRDQGLMIDKNDKIKITNKQQNNTDKIISLTKFQEFNNNLKELINQLELTVDNWKTEGHDYFKKLRKTIHKHREFRQIINKINNNKDVIFRKADKGKRLVVLYKDLYILEANKQLSDENYYKKIDKPRIQEIRGRIIFYLEQLFVDGFITKSEAKKLYSSKIAYSDRYFYLLPKIHKPMDKWTIKNILPKGRPVVSYTNSNLEHLGQFIDYYLQNVAIRTDSYLKNSQHLIHIINNLHISDWSNLGIWTADIVSLYPNIDIQYGINNIKECLRIFPDKKRPDEICLELLKLILENNDFIFLNQRYLQIKGTAMGAPFSPSYANSVLHIWEKDLVQKYCSQIVLYKRYIDDIFIITKIDSKPNGLEILQELNSLENNLKLEITNSPKNQIFLDIHFQILDKQLIHQTNFKSTDTRKLLPTTSQHPKHIFKGILKSQICRYLRNSNDKKLAYNNLKSLINLNSSHGYTFSMAKSIWKEELQKMRFLENHKTYYYVMCSSQNCLTCPLIDIDSQIIRSKYGGNSIRISGHFTCQDSNIIYILTCKHCNLQYIGLSTMTMQKRMTNHRSCLNNPRNQTKLLYKHFWENNLNLTDISLQIIYKLPKSRLNNLPNKYWIQNLLQHYESYYIRKLNTLKPMGFNEKLGKKLRINIPVVIKWSNRNQKLINACKRLLKEYIKQHDLQHLPIRFIPAYYVGKKIGKFIMKNKM